MSHSSRIWFPLEQLSSVLVWPYQASFKAALNVSPKLQLPFILIFTVTALPQSSLLTLKTESLKASLKIIGTCDIEGSKRMEMWENQGFSFTHFTLGFLLSLTSIRYTNKCFPPNMDLWISEGEQSVAYTIIHLVFFCFKESFKPFLCFSCTNSWSCSRNCGWREISWIPDLTSALWKCYLYMCIYGHKTTHI